jgi:TfoX/Sxy family transcriptional regulator of competence genes
VRGLTEKRMFGGLAILINGNMAVSATSPGGLLLRMDPVQTDALINEPHAQRLTMRGREMDGWVRIDADALETDDELERWIDRGVAYARPLPPK